MLSDNDSKAYDAVCDMKLYKNDEAVQIKLKRDQIMLRRDPLKELSHFEAEESLLKHSSKP